MIKFLAYVTNFLLIRHVLRWNMNVVNFMISMFRFKFSIIKRINSFIYIYLKMQNKFFIGVYKTFLFSLFKLLIFIIYFFKPVIVLYDFHLKTLQNLLKYEKEIDFRFKLELDKIRVFKENLINFKNWFLLCKRVVTNSEFNNYSINNLFSTNFYLKYCALYNQSIIFFLAFKYLLSVFFNNKFILKLHFIIFYYIFLFYKYLFFAIIKKIIIFFNLSDILPLFFNTLRFILALFISFVLKIYLNFYKKIIFSTAKNFYYYYRATINLNAKFSIIYSNHLIFFSNQLKLFYLVFYLKNKLFINVYASKFFLSVINFFYYNKKMLPYNLLNFIKNVPSIIYILTILPLFFLRLFFDLYYLYSTFKEWVDIFENTISKIIFLYNKLNILINTCFNKIRGIIFWVKQVKWAENYTFFIIELKICGWDLFHWFARFVAEETTYSMYYFKLQQKELWTPRYLKIKYILAWIRYIYIYIFSFKRIFRKIKWTFWKIKFYFPDESKKSFLPLKFIKVLYLAAKHIFINNSLFAKLYFILVLIVFIKIIKIIFFTATFFLLNFNFFLYLKILYYYFINYSNIFRKFSFTSNKCWKINKLNKKINRKYWKRFKFKDWRFIRFDNSIGRYFMRVRKKHRFFRLSKRIRVLSGIRRRRRFWYIRLFKLIVLCCLQKKIKNKTLKRDYLDYYFLWEN